MPTKPSKLINTTDCLKRYKNSRILYPPDCPDDILDKVLQKVRQYLSEYDIDTEGIKISEKLKTYMDEHFDKYWHVICGRHFGSYAIHESNRFLYFYIDNIAFLLYKSG